MDIKNTDNKCDLKCSFNFNYGEITIQTLITNNTLLIKCGIQSVKPVKFNDFEYVPTMASITYPSMTKYNGISAEAELTIAHTSNLQKMLIIRIPISIGSITKPQQLEEIINQTSKLLPKTGFTNLNIPSFSFESFVPTGPFYFSETSNSYDIYYGLDHSLFITDETMTLLKQIIINPFETKTEPPGELFYNVSGSNLSTNGSSGANWNFLECEQYYEEEVPVITPEGGQNVFGWIFSNPTYVRSIATFCGVVLLLVILYYMYKSFTKDLNTPTSTSPTPTK
jgi:hypothetical protein